MTKFKVGDRVRRIKKDRDFSFKIGDIGVIKEVDVSSVPYLINGDWNYEKYLELVEVPEFKYQWKKGDKLEVVEITCTSLMLGDIVTADNDIATNSEVKNTDVITHDGKLIDGICSSRYKKVENETNIESSENNQMDIETLKTFSEDNLVEGKKRSEEEKANYEAEEAKKAFTALIDRKEKQDRVIKVAKEELKKIGDDLKVFGK